MQSISIPQSAGRVALAVAIVLVFGRDSATVAHAEDTVQDRESFAAMLREQHPDLDETYINQLALGIDEGMNNAPRPLSNEEQAVLYEWIGANLGNFPFKQDFVPPSEVTLMVETYQRQIANYAGRPHLTVEEEAAIREQANRIEDYTRAALESVISESFGDNDIIVASAQAANEAIFGNITEQINNPLTPWGKRLFTDDEEKAIYLAIRQEQADMLSHVAEGGFDRDGVTQEELGKALATLIRNASEEVMDQAVYGDVPEREDQLHSDARKEREEYKNLMNAVAALTPEENPPAPDVVESQRNTIHSADSVSADDPPSALLEDAANFGLAPGQISAAEPAVQSRKFSFGAVLWLGVLVVAIVVVAGVAWWRRNANSI